MPWRFNPFTGNLDETDIPAFNGEVTLGSAASPSIFFTGDTNTGLYSPGADQVALSTNGTGRLFVDASGSVGIGSSGSGTQSALTFIEGSGACPLEIDATSGSGGYLAFSNSGSAKAFFGFGSNLGTASVNDIAIRSQSGALAFQTGGGNERLRITSAGLVGIGTSSPSTLLHVSGGSGTTFTLDGDNSYLSTAAILMNQGRSEIRTTIAASGGNPGGSLLFRTRNNSGSLVDAVTIDSSQRVGIGTTSPSGQLSVTFNGNSVQGIVATDTGTPAVGNYYLLLGSSGGIQNVASNEVHHSAVSALAFRTGSGNGAERARIDSSGRLLVGTSSDSGGALLQVNGDRIRVATAKTPASASDTGTTGEICWDASYIYVCTATNTWKRAALSTW